MKQADDATTAEQDARHLHDAFRLAAGFVALLWLIELLTLALGLDLTALSIFPRAPAGLTGILAAPLLHGSPTHLLANTAPLLVLGTAMLYGYPKAARIALPAIWLGTGAAVWLLARPSWHLGASGLVFGMLLFVLTLGVLRWDRRAIALSLAVLLLYGGMIWGVLPLDPRVSFESHLAGALIGLALAVRLKGMDPPPPEKKYSWETGDQADDDWPLEAPAYAADRERGSGSPGSDRGPASGPRP